MENNNADEVDKLVTAYRGARLRLVRASAAIALAHFKASFTNQGFTDRSLVKWKPRIGGPRNKGRGVLVDKAVLKRGVRIKRADVKQAVVGVDDAIKYAEIHNNGGEIQVTPRMRRFFWAMYYKSGGAHEDTRKDEVAQFWLRMALRKDNTITIPKRQFIGDSASLNTRVTTYLEKELNKIFDV